MIAIYGNVAEKILRNFRGQRLPDLNIIKKSKYAFCEKHTTVIYYYGIAVAWPMTWHLDELPCTEEEYVALNVNYAAVTTSCFYATNIQVISYNYRDQFPMILPMSNL